MGFFSLKLPLLWDWFVWYQIKPVSNVFFSQRNWLLDAIAVALGACYGSFNWIKTRTVSTHPCHAAWAVRAQHHSTPEAPLLTGLQWPAIFRSLNRKKEENTAQLTWLIFLLPPSIRLFHLLTYISSHFSFVQYLSKQNKKYNLQIEYSTMNHEMPYTSQSNVPPFKIKCSTI